MKHKSNNKQGRPRLDKNNELMHHYSVRLTDKQATDAIKNGAGNLGKGVRHAIEYVTRNMKDEMNTKTHVDFIAGLMRRNEGRFTPNEVVALEDIKKSLQQLDVLIAASIAHYQTLALHEE